MIELLLTAVCLYWTALPGVDAYEVCWTGPTSDCAVVSRWDEDWGDRCGGGGPPGDMTWCHQLPVLAPGELYYLVVQP